MSNKNKKGQEISLNKVIKDADKVLVITETKGHLQTYPVKNINYATEITGILYSALSLYQTKTVAERLTRIQNLIAVLSKNLLTSKELTDGEKKE